MKYAGFSRRFFAFWIDLILVGAVVFAVGAAVNAQFGLIFDLRPPVSYNVTKTETLSKEIETDASGVREMIVRFENKVTYFGLWSNYYRGEYRKKEGSKFATWVRWPVDPVTKERVYAIDTGILGFVLLVVVYHPLLESRWWQASLGKRLLKVMVVDEAGKKLSFMRALGRNVGKLISGLILSVGFLMAGWTKKKQALHDKMAKTLVIRRPLTQKDLDEIYA